MAAGLNDLTYRLLRTLAAPARRPWPTYLLSVAAVIAATWVGTKPGDSVPRPAAPGALPSGAVAELQARAARARSAWARVEAVYEQEIAPIMGVLLRRRDDPALARRIALALVREARRTNLEPRLLLSVLLVENPWLDPTARSPVGAVGLMQVMPFHKGKWPPCEPDLEDIEANICHGAQIFAHNFRLVGRDLEQALLRYNGCISGENTPDCHRYPSKVFAVVGRTSLQAWLHAPSGSERRP